MAEREPNKRFLLAAEVASVVTREAGNLPSGCISCFEPFLNLHSDKLCLPLIALPFSGQPRS